MKKLLLFALILMLSVGICSAQQGFFAGAQMGYTMGGDIEESDLGFGAQAGMELSDNASIELSWNKFTDEQSDEYYAIEADASVIAATLRMAMPVSDSLKVYGGAGVNYLMIDVSFKIKEAALEEIAGLYGLSIEDIMAGGDIDLEEEADMDNTIGFHICGGASANVTDTVQVFGEYRYTFGKVKGEGIDEDYNYGILRAGANILF